MVPGAVNWYVTHRVLLSVRVILFSDQKPARDERF